MLDGLVVLVAGRPVFFAHDHMQQQPLAVVVALTVINVIDPPEVLLAIGPADLGARGTAYTTAAWAGPPEGPKL